MAQVLLTCIPNLLRRDWVPLCRPRDIRAYANPATAAEASDLQAGCLVEFKTETRQDLALLQRPNGKANWFATDVRSVKLQLAAYKPLSLHFIYVICEWRDGYEWFTQLSEASNINNRLSKCPDSVRSKHAAAHRGQTYSLQPRQMVYILPGGSYKEGDLQQIHDQALKEADVALLEDAWEVSCLARTARVDLKLLKFLDSKCNTSKIVMVVWALRKMHT